MAEQHSILSLSNEAFGWYLTGLTDGEGSFVLAKSTQKNKRFPKWCTKFNITMRADETANLRAIFERLKCGTLYEWISPSCPGNPVTLWTVCRREVLAEIIIPHFDKFPLQFKKARDFAIWKPCVLLLCEINKRKQETRRGMTRLTQSENSFLEESVAALKSTRKFRSSQVNNPQTFTKPVSIDLFSSMPCPEESIELSASHAVRPS